MIPSSSGFLSQDFTIEEQTTRTYHLDVENQTIQGYADGVQAIEQAIYKMFYTDRYKYSIYSWNYGVEFDDLIGEPISYVLPEIQRRIEDVLLFDKRIKSVDSFNFEVVKNSVYVSFTAHSIFGDIDIERAVNI